MEIDTKIDTDESIVGDIKVVRGGMLTTRGTLRGSVLVEEGGSFKMLGIMNGALRTAGGHAEIIGTFTGDISIESGSVDVYGIVTGIIPEAGVSMRPGCIVNGIKM